MGWDVASRSQTAMVQQPSGSQQHRLLQVLHQKALITACCCWTWDWGCICDWILVGLANCCWRNCANSAEILTCRSFSLCCFTGGPIVGLLVPLRINPTWMAWFIISHAVLLYCGEAEWRVTTGRAAAASRCAGVTYWRSWRFCRRDLIETVSPVTTFIFTAASRCTSAAQATGKQRGVGLSLT